MNILNSIMQTQNIELYILAAILFISFIWIIVLTASLTRLNKKYKKFMRGSTGKSIEQLIFNQLETIDISLNKVEELNSKMGILQEQTDRCIQKCNIIRYNAFKDTGSDLSYSIALTDNYNNGILLSGIYGRNDSATYAKPIENGHTKYQLSVEEEMVLGRCIKKAK